MPSAYDTEYKSLDNVRERLNQEISKDTLDMSWAAFHASQSANRSLQLGESSLLPLFQEQAHSEAMIRHAIDVVSCTLSQSRASARSHLRSAIICNHKEDPMELANNLW